MNAAPSVPDVTVAVLTDRLTMQVPSSLDWVRPTIEHLRRRALLGGVCDEEGATKVALALQEALTNCIVHGNFELCSDLKEQGEDAFGDELLRRAADPLLSSRTVTIEVLCDGAVCHWTLTDQGRGFDFAPLLQRADQEPSLEDLMRSSGRGMRMMRAFVDDVSYDLQGRRVRLSVQRPAWREQRRHPRLPVRRAVQVAPLRTDGSVDWEAAQGALSRDLSAGGVSLVLDSLTQADRVVVGLDTADGMVFLPAEVRHCLPMAAGLIEIGCRFRIADESPPAEGARAAEAALDRLLDGLYAREQRHGERRDYSRVRFTERIEVSAPQGQRRQVFARDLSRGGVAFISTQPFEPGVVAVHLPHSGAGPLCLPARVLRCRPIADGFYDVAACFLTGG